MNKDKIIFEKIRIERRFIFDNTLQIKLGLISVNDNKYKNI